MVECTWITGLLAWLVADDAENDMPVLVAFFLLAFATMAAMTLMKRKTAKIATIPPAVAALFEDVVGVLDPLLPLLSTKTVIEDVLFKPFKSHAIAVSVT